MGIFLAILCAFFESIKDGINKGSLVKVDAYTLGWVFRTISFLLLIPLLFFIRIPTLSGDFYRALFFSGILNAFATILYMKALKYGDLSNSIPLIALTPSFLIITSPIMTGEVLTYQGILGVSIGIIGAYIIGKDVGQKWFDPFLSLLKNPGSRYMLCVAIIYSITSNLDKIGIEHSSPLFWLLSINAFLSLLLFPIMIFFGEKNALKIIQASPKITLGSIVGTMAVIAQVYALTYAPVTYVISLKRLSAVFGVLIGYYFFHEKNIQNRLIGSLAMVLGSICIIFS